MYGDKESHSPSYFLHWIPFPQLYAAICYYNPHLEGIDFAECAFDYLFNGTTIDEALMALQSNETSYDVITIRTTRNDKKIE
jgi:hypothetical protein